MNNQGSCFIWPSAESFRVWQDVFSSNLSKVDIVGLYPNYASAYAAWRAKAQGTVDNAEMRYFIVHLHRLLDPEAAPAH